MELSTIEKYISGGMEAAEMAAFEEILKQDSALQAEVEAYRDIIAGVERAGEKQFAAMLQGWEQEIQQKAKPHAASKRFLFSSRNVLMIAAAIVLLLSFTFIFPSGASSFDDAFQPYADEISVMGKTDLDAQQVSQAMKAYNDGKYQEALPQLQALAEQHPDVVVIKLYVGIAAMQSEQFPIAQRAFNELQVSPSSYTQASEWYEALMYEKQDNMEAAKNQLTGIANTPGHIKQKAAQKLLAEL